jgi:hypothetical protein
LWADPDFVPDPATSIVPAVDDGLLPNEHPVAELKRLGVSKADAKANSHAIAALPSHCSKANAAHQLVDLAVASTEALKLNHNLGAVAAPGQLFGQADLESGVGRDVSNPVHGAYDAGCSTLSR